MKKIELKFDFRKLQKDSQNTNWQKAILGAIFASLIIFLAATVYLFVRPISADIQQEVDAEMENQEVNFNFTTLKKLESRQTPNPTIESPSGKNPFTPY